MHEFLIDVYIKWEWETCKNWIRDKLWWEYDSVEPESLVLKNYLEWFLVFSDANECELIGVCENGGSCVNTNGSYACRCVEGWEGPHCENGQLFIVFQTLRWTS